jgi:hypothetical protein
MCYGTGDPQDFEVTILEDGTVKLSFANMAGDYHMRADQLAAFLAAELGGETTVTRAKPVQTAQWQGQRLSRFAVTKR